MLFLAAGHPCGPNTEEKFPRIPSKNYETKSEKVQVFNLYINIYPKISPAYEHKKRRISPLSVIVVFHRVLNTFDFMTTMHGKKGELKRVF